MSNKGKKQSTLLQTWGYEGNAGSWSQAAPTPPRPSTSAAAASSTPDRRINTSNAETSELNRSRVAAGGADMDVDMEDEDEFLRRAMEASLAQLEVDERQRQMATAANAAATLANPTVVDPSDPNHHGFDASSGSHWIYPTNFPEREYQFKIVESCLYENTLVTLPTGLGKTFIAAVVMYNYFRWFPSCKVVFVAPTKPLVAQQIEACFNIMGVPQIETIELTGSVAVATRKSAYEQKRIFFATPQVISNDLSRGLFPADKLRLIVVDEAHRAQGDYAYCLVIKELMQTNKHFRVVALSATPGTDIQAVRSMLQNLLISHIELRNEDSPDIVPYTFQRKIEKVVVPLGVELKAVREKYLAILEYFVKRLSMAGALSGRRSGAANPTNYTKFGLLKLREEFRRNPPANLATTQRGAVEGDFAASITLYHAYELLLQHGLRAFRNFLAKSMDAAEGGNHRLRNTLNNMPVWQELDAQLAEKFAGDANNSRLNASGPAMPSQLGSDGGLPQQPPSQVEDIVLGHPKLEKLRDMVVEHFRAKEAEGVATRVMIFSQYRDSVQEIRACLDAYRPLVKVMEFVGQAGAKGKKGLSQKQQIKVVNRFRDGGFNTLVATCVGEEGLDIGEVDLIVCYDVSKSPIRLVQRMGRTGRKREGRIIVLVTEGKEENTYNQSMYTKNSINRAITEKAKLTDYLCKAPRMIPKDLKPLCMKMVMKKQTFINAKANEAVGPKNNRRISGMLVSAGKAAAGTAFRQTSGFLSSSELQYWTDNFHVDEENVPRLKAREERWNKPRSSGSTPFSVEGAISREYDLAEWLLWQDKEPNRRIVSGSSSTRMLLGALSASRSGMDLDTVHREMLDLWLDPDDVEEDTTEAGRTHEKVTAPKRTITGHFKKSPVGKKELAEAEVVDLTCDDVGLPPTSPLPLSPIPATIAPDRMQSALCDKDWPPHLNAAFDDTDEPFVIRPPPGEVPVFTQEDLAGYDFVGAFSRIFGRSKIVPVVERKAAEGSWAGDDDDSLFKFDITEAINEEKEKVETLVKSPDRKAVDTTDPGSPVFRPSQLLPARGPTQRKTSTPNVRASLSSRLGVKSAAPLEVVPEDSKCPQKSDDTDYTALFNDSSFDVVEPSRMAASADTVSSRLDSLKEKRKQRETLESAVVNECIEDIQLNDSLLNEMDDEGSGGEEKRGEKEKGKTLYGPTQLANLLNRTKSDGLDDAAPDPQPAFAHNVQESEDLFANEADDSVFLAVSGQTPFKRSATAGTSHLGRLARSNTSTPNKSKLAHDESSLCFRAGGRRRYAAGPALSSDEEEKSPKKVSAADEGRSSDAENRDQSSEILVCRKRRRVKKSAFVDDEAELSDEEAAGVSSDEDEPDEDGYEASFVNDATQKVDKAMYLKSVKSPKPKPMMRKPLRPVTADLFSQAVDFDAARNDAYEEDSFCVGDDSEQLEYQSEPDALDHIEETEQTMKFTSAVRKGGCGKMKSSPVVSESSEAGKKRKRIMAPVSSSEDDLSLVKSPNTRRDISPAEEAKAARLRRQKEMQEKFRQTMKQKQERKVSSEEESQSILGPNPQAPAPIIIKPSMSAAPEPQQQQQQQQPKPTVVFSSSEVHKMAGLISLLKHRSGLAVNVERFEGALVLASPRMGIDWVLVAEFCNGSNKEKVLNRCRRMNNLYDRPVLILETDKGRDDDGHASAHPARNLLGPTLARTKYIDALTSRLSQSKMQVLYSDSSENTADIITGLRKSEQSKGFAFPSPLNIGDYERRVMPFYQSLPGVGFGTALLLATTFSSVKNFITCAPATLKRRANMDDEKVKRIKKFLGAKC